MLSNHMCARKKSCKKKTVPGIYEVTRAFFVKKGRSASNSIVLKFFQREAFVRLNRDAVIIGLWPCYKLYYVFQKKWIHSLKWKSFGFSLMDELHEKLIHLISFVICFYEFEYKLLTRLSSTTKVNPQLQGLIFCYIIYQFFGNPNQFQFKSEIIGM